MSSIIEKLNDAFPHIKNGLGRGELSTVCAPVRNTRTGVFDTFLRNRKLEQIGYSISDDPAIHQRIREDGIRMNRKTYEFLIGSPELYPYYVHNIFRDITGIEKIYDYDAPPITKVTVPDLPTASVYIANFRFIMADQTVKIPYKIKKTLVVNQGNTAVILELITFE